MSSLSSISLATAHHTERVGAARSPAIKPPSDAVEGSPAAKPASDRVELTSEEKKEVVDLKERDAEVRRHEQAHLAAAGPYGKGPPAYELKEGPDGKQYAVGGHVEIDTEEIKGDPQATLEKARVVRRAALAPQEPSAQDRKVAREAVQMERKAERELQAQKTEETDAGVREASGTPTDEAADYPRKPSGAQGYDRHGSPVRRASIRARLDIVA